ncbi:MAG: hypothetical protein AAGF12_01065 [Myxococcota bacterium]
MTRRTIWLERWRLPVRLGTGVGLAVAAVLMVMFEVETLGGGMIGGAGGLLAMVTATVGLQFAVRARGTAEAVAIVLAWTVIPPMTLFLPTVIGLFFALPAGLLTCAILLPAVLFRRHWEPLAMEPRRRREGVVVGATLMVFTVVVLGVAATAFERVLFGNEPWAPVWLIPAALLVALTGILLGLEFLRDLRGWWRLRVLAHKPRTDFVVRHATGGWEVRRVFDGGPGPHRDGRIEGPVAFDQTVGRTLVLAVVLTVPLLLTGVAAFRHMLLL